MVNSLVLGRPILRRTTSDAIPEVRTAPFSYTSFLRFAPLRQRRHILLDDGGGYLRCGDMM
jgi:hypothetical protein